MAECSLLPLYPHPKINALLSGTDPSWSSMTSAIYSYHIIFLILLLIVILVCVHIQFLLNWAWVYICYRCWNYSEQPTVAFRCDPILGPPLGLTEDFHPQMSHPCAVPQRIQSLSGFCSCKTQIPGKSRMKPSYQSLLGSTIIVYALCSMQECAKSVDTCT